MNDCDRVIEAIIEPVGMDEVQADFEGCPCCESMDLLRLLGRFPRAICWVVYCSECGKFLTKRWNLLD